jgi:hypothetical protein
VSRGPADRPIRSSDEDAALQAAMRQAAERGAAPASAARAPDPDPPASGGRVAETAPVRAVTGVPRQRAARSFVLSKVQKKGKKDSPEREKLSDPRGRGSVLDFRI